VSISAPPVHIYRPKPWIFAVTQDGSNASAYCSIGKLNMPRIFRPSVRAGAMGWARRLERVFAIA
jgi:hypothetical protein